MSQGNTVSIDIGGGRAVAMDSPPAVVLAAARRINARLERGLQPRANDGVTLARWLSEQENKHG